jgi:hypothetical protein
MHRCTWAVRDPSSMDSAAPDNDIARGFMGDVDRTLLRENLKLKFE